MNYRYKCGDKVIKAWVHEDEKYKIVTVKSDITDNFYNKPIKQDDKGRFFIWEHNKIYLDDWIRITMEELKEKVESNQFISSDDLCQAILTDGIENARFLIPLKTYSHISFGILLPTHKLKDTVCKVKEGYNRKVVQDYKLIFVPEQPDSTIEAKCEFYTSDLVGLIRKGAVKIIA